MVLNIHELWPLHGLYGTVLVLIEKKERQILKFSNNCSMTPNSCYGDESLSLMTRGVNDMWTVSCLTVCVDSGLI